MFLPISLLKINARDKQKKGFMISIGIMVKYFASIHLLDPLISSPKKRVENKRIKKKENNIILRNLILLISRKEIRQHSVNPTIR